MQIRPVVIVTGASKGIGAHTARRFAGAGYAVVANFHHDAAGAAQLAEEIRASGGECLTVPADVGNEAEVLALFDACQLAFGPPTVLVNNAGILMPQARLENFSLERMRTVLQTNVLGTLLCCREAVRRMSTRHGGSGGVIVNLSSVAARSGSPGEYIDYACSKGAIDTLTKGLATEVAQEGIRVNAVRPGFIHTAIHASGGEPGRVKRLAPRVPLQRGGQPEEVAEAIFWLASDAASYVTGSVLDVTGGV
ncbi:SDR family oxidoreductase [Inhella sp.]|uniref:SDR family oxidoreductase n=1 Tax=Inhella sp. TaxID=1921806 RepID=UPI0035B43D73